MVYVIYESFLAKIEAHLFIFHTVDGLIKMISIDFTVKIVPETNGWIALEFL